VRTLTPDANIRPLVIGVTNGRGLVIAEQTGFVVDCGNPVSTCGPPPATPRSPDACLFVGVYGRTELRTLAPPPQRTAFLDTPRSCTYVEPNGPPNPFPPATLPEGDFQALLDATTIVGTGNKDDRLSISPPESTIERPAPPQFCLSDPCFGPVPDQVIDELPLPPPPPLFPGP
jgi:hypothetical protein